MSASVRARVYGFLRMAARLPRRYYYFHMQRFTPPLNAPGGHAVDVRPADLEAVIEENRRLKGLVIYLSSLVIKNVVEPTP
jgi:hypothetical protein